MKAAKFHVSDARSLVEECLSLEYFHPNKDGVVPIQAHWKPGAGKLLVVLGENASGKSFFRRVVCAVCRDVGIEAIHLSMEGRNSTGFGGLRVMVYGDEEEESTGVNSAYTVTKGIATCRGRENKHVIFWDEPDLGLSDNNAAGLGIVIRDFAADAPTNTIAAIVVTHSKALVQQLLPIGPHYLYLGEENVPQTIEEWLKAPIVPSPIGELKAKSRRRWGLISEILQAIKKRRAK